METKGKKANKAKNDDNVSLSPLIHLDTARTDTDAVFS
jgi:hypothetical protein